jgi:hypothetical protein
LEGDAMPMKLKIDDGLMYSAISNAEEAAGQPECKGYLNRKTGEIAFVYRPYGEADTWYGEVAGTGGLRKRAEMDRSPDEWLEIPKYHGGCSEDEFIRDFLGEHGIDWPNN